MDIYSEIDAVYQRALVIQQRATESPVQPELVEEALDELRFVLEELQVSHVELRRQNRELTATRLAVDWERQRYRALFELAPDGYLVTDPQGKIYNANRAAEYLFATPQEYLINKPLMALIDKTDRLRFQTRLIDFNMSKAKLSEQERNWEVLLNPYNGERRLAAIAVTKVIEESDPDRVEGALLWLFRDVTLRQ